MFFVFLIVLRSVDLFSFLFCFVFAKVYLLLKGMLTILEVSFRYLQVMIIILTGYLKACLIASICKLFVCAICLFALWRYGASCFSPATLFVGCCR